uniref:Jumonji domain containing 1C n=2 Tax=Sinocyclocheilus grahami TaxID=75366 RepID=A0A672PTK3_SINGR
VAVDTFRGFFAMVVGKRFLCVSGEEPLEPAHIASWSWRAGVIRAVTHHDYDNPELTVYVEFDDLEWDKREWVKVYEDFQIFLLEHQLVWVKRKEGAQLQGTKAKQIQWPALTFKPLVGKTVLGSITAIEFFSDRHLDFLTDEGACQPYQDEVDSLSPVFRDYPHLHEEVKAWVKDQKVQEIFMQGPYSLNGYRVRVYRQDSATQWFTGIITHHDLFSRTMVVMNDQVLEPQNVDPSMIQMTFLDDVVHSLLKGENIGITSRRRSRSSQNSNTAHGHYTRAQANSPRPVMNSSGSTPKQASQAQQQQSSRRKGSDSSVPDDEKIKDEKSDSGGKDSSKNKSKQTNKRRKADEEDKKGGLKRLKTETSDLSESSDSENSNKRSIDSSSEPSSENELKCKSTSKVPEEEEKSQGSKPVDELSVINRLSPWDEMQDKSSKPVAVEVAQLSESERSGERRSPLTPPASCTQNQASGPTEVQSCIVEMKSTVKTLPKDLYGTGTPLTHTPKCVIDITEDAIKQSSSRENSEAVSALLASQKYDAYIPESRHLVQNASHSECRRPDGEQQQNARSIGGKIEFTHSEVIRPVTSVSELAALGERGKLQQQYTSMVIKNALLTEDIKKTHKLSPSPELPKPKSNSSPDILKPKCSPSPDIIKPKIHSVSKHKPRHLENPPTTGRLPLKPEPDIPRYSFKPVPARGGPSESRKSPLVDKNEPFSVYRDPALVRPESDSNHMTYLHPHLHPLHGSSHATCLTRSSHHPSHLLPSSSMSHSVHHPHLLTTVLPTIPSTSLLGSHPRLDSPGLGHLALAHHHSHQQQQFLQQQPPPTLLAQTHGGASYNQLGLYPIIWQYPNGTHSYPPGYKWVHPENAVNSDSSLRRNTSSPWLHQSTPVTSADSMGILSHVPGRPASADPHRPIKISSHSSPPLSKTPGELHKEDQEKNLFVDPMHSMANAHLKQEPDRSRTPTNKELHRFYMESPHSKQQLPPRMPQGGPDRTSKYKEENHRILRESIEMAPFTAKICAGEPERKSYPRISSQPKSHEKEVEHSVADLYKYKHSVSQSLPQTNYFTTLSNSVVNEPPRLFQSKDLNPYFDKAPAVSSPLSLGSYNSSHTKSLSKPPPLIKHQPEGEGLVGKISEQLSQQALIHSLSTSVVTVSERCSPAISPSSQPKGMPALRRAPVFHPPTQQALDRKEGAYGRLSPPTLTPIQPVSSAGKVSEQQKPPTLLPELRDEKSGAELGSADSCRSGGEAKSHEKVAWHSENSQGKPQAAMASVIVRPSTCIKYDGFPGPKMAPKEQLGSRLFAGRTQAYCLKVAESRESGRVILPNTNLEDPSEQYNKNLIRASPVVIPSSVAVVANSVCNTRTNESIAAASSTFSMQSHNGADLSFSISSASGSSRLESSASKSRPPTVVESQEGGSRTTSPSALPQASSAGPTQAYSRNFVHLKKAKAALAAAQSRGSSSASESESGSVRSSQDSPTIAQDNSTPSNPASKASPVPNGQPAQVCQSNYHKLKKAWLTRHSEEDKNTNKSEKNENAISELIKPCSVNLIAPASSDVDLGKDSKEQEDKLSQEDRKTRRTPKRPYESGSESGDDSDSSESKLEQRTKRQPKPTYKKKQNDMQKRKGDNEKEEDEVKPNGIFRSAKEKTKLKLASTNGIPRSVLKDWRKVKKLKQTGESFLQDDSCSEIGPNLQKCRECRSIRTKKGEESAHSPVFCRFYHFRRLSYSKNGVIRIDGFSAPDQYDEEALSLWAPEGYEENILDLETSKYILSDIGDKFCQLVMTENTATTWIKKDAKIAWKRAVRGVRESCDACEATLFNIHWVCQKCGFVVCLDCYKAKERKSSKDKELYAWLKCVKGQPHDHKHLMPTQIIPGTVLADLVNAMHMLREKYSIKSYCSCAWKQNTLYNKLPSTNGVSQVLQNVLNHSNKISLCKPEGGQQNSSLKVEANGGSSPASDTSTDSKFTPPESQSPLHFLADLAEQKSREEKKENKESGVGKIKEEKDQSDALESLHSKASSLEQGSTLRDLLTTTAGKLRLGSTDAGIAFAPVYSTASQSGRSMPNILDDIIASVVENKIPAGRGTKLNLKHEPLEEPKAERKKAVEEPPKQYADIPHCWLYERRLLWLKDHRNNNNWKLFRECWRQGQPALVSGVHKKLNASLWKAESFNQEFADHQGDLLNCKDGVMSNSGVKEFWDGFEDLTSELSLTLSLSLSVAKEQGVEIPVDNDPIREPAWYLSRKLRQRLLDEYAIQGWTVVQFLGDSVLIPAGALHQVQNLHSCVQVINDFVSPEHVVHSFHLTQELRSSKEEINYEDKLQVEWKYHSMSTFIGILSIAHQDDCDRHATHV